MASRIPIEIEPERGYARLGTMRVTLTPEPGGVLRVGAGAAMQAVTFAERDVLIVDAIGADDPVEALALAVTSQSVIHPGDLPSSVLIALALALAGGVEDTLSFAEAAALAARREQWSWDETLNAPAWLVDRAATEGPVGSGWSTIVFSSADPPDLDALAREMSLNLLRRSRPRISDRAVAERQPAGPVPRSGQRPVPGQEAQGAARSNRRGPSAAIHHEAASGIDADRAARPATPASVLPPAAAEHRGVAPDRPGARAARPSSPPPSAGLAATGPLPGPGAPATTSWPRAATAHIGTDGPRADSTLAAHSRRSTMVAGGAVLKPVSSSQRPAGTVAPEEHVVFRRAPQARSEQARSAALPAVLRSADWVEAVAAALATECDLRGLDQ